MSDLVGNPEDRFSRVTAHMVTGPRSQQTGEACADYSVIK